MTTTKLYLPAIIIFSIIACTHPRVNDTPKSDTPKALKENARSFQLISKRGYDDLMESLYNELLNKNIDLKKLEDKIDELNSSKNDSTNSFTRFNEKNQSYFSAANRHVKSIKDSIIRNKMENLLAEHLKTYNLSIARHNDLLKIIEKKEVAIEDLHIMLKIIRTLPVIEKYQHDNLPDTKSIEGYINKQNETLMLEATLIKN